MTAATPATASRTGAPEARTAAGAVRGFWRAGSAAFLGVPFAAPPVGQNRFAAPAPPEPWDGVRDATAYGPTPQRRPFGELTAIPEPSIPGRGTLNVNVFTPAPGDTRAGLPVLAWIHGGGYFAGSPASPWYDGAAFNRDGIVTVTVSYRLGFDGFGWIDGAPLNRGILDQIAALDWVRRNIRAFGGDPDKVTVAGQSAGAGSALALLGAPAARGLFRAVISQSGALAPLGAHDAERAGRRLAVMIGTGTALDDWRAVPERAILDHERQANGAAGALAAPAGAAALADSLLDPAVPAGPGLAFAPVLDGQSITETPEQAVRAGRTAGIAILAGTTANEFAYPAHGDGPEAAIERFRAAGIPEDAIAAYTGELRRIGPEYAAGQLWSTALFRLPAVSLAQSRAAAGSAAATWLYDFRYHSPASGLAPHCSEIPFAFGLPNAEGVARTLGGPIPEALVSEMHGAWSRFARDAAAPWPHAAGDAGQAMAFDAESAFDPHAYALEAALIDVRRRAAQPADGAGRA